MWYLRVSTLVLITFAAVIMFFAVLLFKNNKHKVQLNGLLLLALSSFVVFYAGKRLLLFYCLYVLLTYLAANGLRAIKRFRPFFFGLSVLLCLLPFFASRFIDFNISFGFVAIGFIFNMLKAVDAVFYVYYTDQKISLLTYANFIFFIPTFTAGPIFRFRDFQKTFSNPKPVTGKDLELSVKRIIRGLFKKIVILNLVSQTFQHLLGLESSFFVSFLTVIFSYFMLYFDLSGYSDIAIAYGRICGLQVPENFKNPFKAPSFTLFWRNWHVSLSDFIREHLYVLFAKKKLNKAQNAGLAFVTMVCMSLWHGFNLPYLFAGMYNGALLTLENLFSLTGSSKKKSVFYLRCFLVNFLFGLNTLVFTTGTENLFKVLKGFFKI